MFNAIQLYRKKLLFSVLLVMMFLAFRAVTRVPQPGMNQQQLAKHLASASEDIEAVAAEYFEMFTGGTAETPTNAPERD